MDRIIRSLLDVVLRGFVPDLLRFRPKGIARSDRDSLDGILLPQLKGTLFFLFSFFFLPSFFFRRFSLFNEIHESDCVNMDGGQTDRSPVLTS